jgi:hypothetical protein
MESLPPGAVVVCMGSTVRLVSQRKFLVASGVHGVPWLSDPTHSHPYLIACVG